MAQTQLVIKGAIYHDNDSDTILKPHFTGEYWMVDCTRYKRIEEIKDQYTKDFLIENKADHIVYDGVKYFYAEYSPCSGVENWDLLSDLSEIEHCNESREF